MQIRLKLTLQFILITAGILLATFIYIQFQFRQKLQDEFYKSLKAKALLIAEVIAGEKSDEQVIDISEVPGHSESTSSSVYPENIFIYSTEGRMLYTLNHTIPRVKEAVFMDVRNYGECRYNQGKYSALAIRYTNQEGKKFIVVAESVFENEYLANLQQILIFVYLIAISLVALGGWFFSRQALRPISAIMNQVDDILPTDMTHRLMPFNQKDELSRLVMTFNKLLDRIEKAFRNQRLFLSNVSHELKNPMSIIISQVEVVLDKDRSGDEYRNTLRSVLSDVKGLNDVADKLMQLARINADDPGITMEPVRFDELIWQATEFLSKTQPNYNIRVDIRDMPENQERLFIQGNESLLKTAFINLMDNGCKFSPDHTIEVVLSAVEEQKMKVAFVDHGPGIAEEELKNIFDPFYRSARTRATRGSGIGLSLVSSIFKLHHVTPEVESVIGKGTTISIVFSLTGK